MKQGKKFERGQVLVILVAAVIALLGLTALAVDGSLAYNERRAAQNSADVAALAGALHLANQGEDCSDISVQTNVQDAAMETANVYASNSGSENKVIISVTAICPPTTGVYAGNEEYVQVTVVATRDTYFGSAVGINTVTNTVTAVAHGRPAKVVPLFEGKGVVSLKNTGNCTVDFNSSALVVNGGTMFVNSNGSTALCSNWGPQVYTDGPIGVVGGIDSDFLNGSGSTNAGSFMDPHPGQLTIPEWSTVVPAPPAPPTCSSDGTWDGYNRVATPGRFTSLSIPSNGGTLQSGTYCFSAAGNSAFSVTGGATLTAGDVVFVFENQTGGATIGGEANLYFDSLIIHIKDGDVVKNGSQIMNVPGVFRYFSTGDSDYAVNGGSTETYGNAFFYMAGGQFDWEGSTTLNLTAPTSPDPYAGLSIYQPPSNTNELQMHGGSSTSVTGTILIPGAHLRMNGSSSATGLHCQIIANTISTGGGSSITITYNPGENRQSLQTPMVELVQ